MFGRWREYVWRGPVYAGLLWLVCIPAEANSVCVTCAGPAAVYTCSYAPDASGSRPNHSGRTLQFACIQDVARQYSHDSCSVRREQRGVCSGPVHFVSRAPVVRPSAPPAQAADGSDEAFEEKPVQKKREPRTVVEFAKRTARDTQKQLDKSARTVSKAARSTWRCVSTLFSKC